jgi:hypothetical protein
MHCVGELCEDDSLLVWVVTEELGERIEFGILVGIPFAALF